MRSMALVRTDSVNAIVPLSAHSKALDPHRLRPEPYRFVSKIMIDVHNFDG